MKIEDTLVCVDTTTGIVKNKLKLNYSPPITVAALSEA
jgi:hypothetical protein